MLQNIKEFDSLNLFCQTGTICYCAGNLMKMTIIISDIFVRPPNFGSNLRKVLMSISLLSVSDKNGFVENIESDTYFRKYVIAS